MCTKEKNSICMDIFFHKISSILRNDSINDLTVAVSHRWKVQFSLPSVSQIDSTHQGTAQFQT